MAFKDLKALGGTPEFQEMMKKLLAEQDAEKTQDASETPVADKIETDVGDKTAANIEEDLKNQKREIISLVNSMLGKRDTENKRDKKSTQVSLTKISSRLTTIDTKLTRILTSITNIGKTISKSYDLQKQRFDNYELDKAKRVDDTKEASRGGKGYTAVKSVDSGGLLKYLSFLLMAGAFLTGFISKWFEGKKEDILKIFAPITAIFLAGGKFGKLVGNLITGINDAVIGVKDTITKATRTVSATLENLTSRFLKAIGKETPRIPQPPTPPPSGGGSPGKPLPGQPASFKTFAEAQDFLDKNPLMTPEELADETKKINDRVSPKAGKSKVNSAKTKISELINRQAQLKLSRDAAESIIKKVTDEVAQVARKTGAFKEVLGKGGALRAATINLIPGLNLGRRGKDYRSMAKETVATDIKLAKFLKNMKRFSKFLIVSGVIGSAVGGGYLANELGLNEPLGSIVGVTAFLGAVSFLKKFIRFTPYFLIIFMLMQQIIDTLKYIMSNPKNSAENEKKLNNLCASWAKAIGGIVANMLTFIVAQGTVGVPAGLVIGFLGGLLAGPGGAVIGATVGSLSAAAVITYLADRKFHITEIGEEIGYIIFKMYSGEITESTGMSEIVALITGFSPTQTKNVLEITQKTANIGSAMALTSMAGVLNMSAGALMSMMTGNNSYLENSISQTSIAGAIAGGTVGLVASAGTTAIGNSLRNNRNNSNIGRDGLGGTTRTPTNTYQGLPQTSAPASRPQASTPPTRRPPASNPSPSSGSGFGNIAAGRGCSPDDLISVCAAN